MTIQFFTSFLEDCYIISKINFIYFQIIWKYGKGWLRYEYGSSPKQSFRKYYFRILLEKLKNDTVSQSAWLVFQQTF